MEYTTCRAVWNQVEACMTETEKLAALISSGSPVVSTYIPASVFLSAEVRIARPTRVVYSSGTLSLMMYRQRHSTVSNIAWLFLHYCTSTLLCFLSATYWSSS